MYLVNLLYRRIRVDENIHRLPLINVVLAVGCLINNGELIDFRLGSEDILLVFSKEFQMLY